MTIKYTVDGRKVELLQEIEATGGAIVRFFYENILGDEAREARAEPRHYQGDLYDSPRSEVLEKNIKASLNEADELQLKVDCAKKELEALRAEHQERLENLAKFECLKRVEDFILGRVTHYLIFKYRQLEIVPFEKALSEGSSYPNEQKLLALYGRKDNIHWKLNQYGDGSGSSYECIPCLSLEEALEKAQAYLDVLSPNQWTPRLLSWARDQQLRVPDGAEDHLLQKARRDTEAQVERLREQLETLEGKL